MVGDLAGDLVGDLAGDLVGDLAGVGCHEVFTRPRLHLRVWPEGGREKVTGLKLGLRAAMRPGILADAPDAGASLLDEADAVQHVGDQGIPAHALVPQVGQRKPLGNTARTHHLDAVGVDLDEDISTVEEPVAVHHGVGDRLAQRLHRVLRDVLASQTVDLPGRARVALDKAQGVLDVGHDPAVEVLAVKDVDLVNPSRQQAGDVRLWKEPAYPLTEEEHTCVAE